VDAHVTAPRWRIADAQLQFDDRPVLLLGGQLHNSTSSSIGGIAEGLRHAREVGGNTVVAPVCWDLSEPVEGEFDFSLVDALLTEADATDLRLVLLWFGAFKNAGSTYAPRWVRADTARFPRARTAGAVRPPFTYEGQTPSPVLSVFSTELREADARAFEALLTFVAGHPLRDRVAMVQIENEIGLLADSRDRSELAEAAWRAQVPDGLIAFLESASDSIAAGLWRAAGEAPSGSWSAVLGEGWEADEVFMAWAFASYVEALAVRGAAIWPVPFYVNAWLGPQPGQDRAGQVPSGGPASRVLDVWRAAAPSLATRSPDIYIDDAAGVIEAYAADGSPLFVPECRLRAGDAVLAIARGALGWSAFGIDDARPSGQVSQLLGQLARLEDLVTTAQRERRLAAIVLEPGAETAEVEVAGFRLVGRGTRALFGRMLLDVGVAELPPAPEPPPETQDGARIAAPHDVRPFALVIAEPDDAFLVLGEGLTLDFFHDDGTVELDSVVAGVWEAGEWVPRAVLNGDERLDILPMDELGVVRIRLLRLP